MRLSSLPFHKKIDYPPDSEARAQRDDESMQYTYRSVEKFHRDCEVRRPERVCSLRIRPKQKPAFCGFVRARIQLSDRSFLFLFVLVPRT